VGEIYNKMAIRFMYIGIPYYWRAECKGIDAVRLNLSLCLRSECGIGYRETWWGNTGFRQFFHRVGSSPEKPDKYDTALKLSLIK